MTETNSNGQLRVLAFPAAGDAGLDELYRPLKNSDLVTIKNFRLLAPFMARYHFLHLHWPEYFIRKSRFLTIITLLYFIVMVSVMRMLRTKIIWTVHNVTPHNNYYPALYARVIRYFVRRLDGVIFMSIASQKEMVKRYPGIRKIPNLINPHPFYTKYPNTCTKDYAKSRLNLNCEARVILFFGRIDHYKNVNGLIKKFLAESQDKMHLVIAGKPTPLMRTQIMNQIEGRNNISIFFGHIPDDEVQFYFNAADLVVLPFSRITNSGSVILSLTFGCVTLVPDIPTLRELKERQNQKNLMFYNDFSDVNLSEIVDNLSHTDRIICRADNNKIVSEYVNFLKRLW